MPFITSKAETSLHWRNAKSKVQKHIEHWELWSRQSKQKSINESRH